MKAHRKSARKHGAAVAAQRADARTDENKELNENASHTSPLIGLDALRESLPSLAPIVDKKATLPSSSKPFLPRFRQTSAFPGSKNAHEKGRSLVPAADPGPTLLRPASAPSSSSARPAADPPSYANVKPERQEGSILSALEAGTRYLESEKRKMTENVALSPTPPAIYSSNFGPVHTKKEEKVEDVVVATVDGIMAEAVRGISGEGEEPVAETPRAIRDAGDPAKDLLYLTNIPDSYTYDRVSHLVRPFGEVQHINWDATSPDSAEVMFAFAQDAAEAFNYLNNSMLGGSEDELLLGAELKNRDGGTQLVVGDLSPNVTEEMLEDAFGRLIGGMVTATLKRDPGNHSTVGYGLLSFADEDSASKALLQGQGMQVHDAKVRVDRAIRNAFLYCADLQPNCSFDDIKSVFGQYGSIVEEETVIVRRSYSFIRFRNRSSAENAKRALDKTSLRGKMTVRYAEAEPQKSTVQVQFHSSLVTPPSSLSEILLNTFGKFGICSINIPRTSDGSWRKTAFVQYHGADPIAAALAATTAVQAVTFVSGIPVLCQFSRELIARVSPKNAAGQQAAKGPRKPFGGENVNSSRHEKNLSRDAASQSQPNVNVQAGEGSIYPSYYSPMAGYPDAWREGAAQAESGAAATENRSRSGGGEFPLHSPGRRHTRDTSRGKRGNPGGADGMNGSGIGMGAMGGMGGQNPSGEVTYMPVWVPAMGQEMPNEFSAPWQYGMLPQSYNMGSGGYHAVEGQPGNARH